MRPPTGLTTFMPARVTREQACSNARDQRDETSQEKAEASDPVVDLVSWQGSGDLVGLAEANCFLVIHPHQKNLAPGDWVDVLPKSW